MDITTLSIVEAKKHMKKGDFTAVELLDAHIKRVEKYKALNAFTEDRKSVV